MNEGEAGSADDSLCRLTYALLSRPYYRCRDGCQWLCRHAELLARHCRTSHRTGAGLAAYRHRQCALRTNELCLGRASATFLHRHGGSLAAGLVLAFNGTLSGTPTVSGSFGFTVTATDRGNFTASQAYTLQVNSPQIAITPALLANVTASNAYALTFAAPGGAAPYNFVQSKGALPPGLTFDANGRVSGTPQTGGSFAFTVEAIDANGFAGTQDLSLTVDGEIPVAQDQSAGLLAGTTAQCVEGEGCQ